MCEWQAVELDHRRQAGAALTLSARDVHVWRIALPTAPCHGRAGADRARAYVHRVRIEILTAYVADAHLSHDENGRLLTDTCDLHVSTSYTQGIALFALARRPIGVDVELQREVMRADVIARAYFGAAEYARWRAERTPATQFLHYWTRKEAYLKALGRGFEHPPLTVDASCDPGAIFNALDAFESLRWAVHSFHPSRGHTAAIAHARDPDSLCRWLTVLST